MDSLSKKRYRLVYDERIGPVTVRHKIAESDDRRVLEEARLRTRPTPEGLKIILVKARR